MAFYMNYLARWPDYFHVAEGPNKSIMGYSKFSTFVHCHTKKFFFGKLLHGIGDHLFKSLLLHQMSLQGS
jgi:hypothetical protein